MSTYRAKEFFTVPDGTEVSPFLNATDVSQANVSWGALGDVSVGAGRIGPHRRSWIHMHPAVTQITYVTSGELLLIKKEAMGEPEPIRLSVAEAAVSQPGDLIQLVNEADETAEVLYIVSPTYVFEPGEDSEPIYDDAVLVAERWEDVPMDLQADATGYEADARRAEALRRVAARLGHGPAGLDNESPSPWPDAPDYDAPDGSHIRVLAVGRRGGFAHAVLDAGSVPKAVTHRTVEELWYVTDGSGEVWRARNGESRVDVLSPGVSLVMSVGTTFQFRADEGGDLALLIATMPPWPGGQEAVPSEKANW